MCFYKLLPSEGSTFGNAPHWQQTKRDNINAILNYRTRSYKEINCSIKPIVKRLQILCNQKRSNISKREQPRFFKQAGVLFLKFY